MWTIAQKTLLADKGKLATALIGVIFSVVLVNVQGGLFLGLIRKAGLLVDQGQADIWVGHKWMHNVDLPRDIPVRWGDRLRSIPGVGRADAYLVGFSEMTLPDGSFEGILVVGAQPTSLLGGSWNIRDGNAASVLKNDGVVVDACDNDKLGFPSLGEIREVGGKRVRIVAKSYGVTGFMAAPYVFTTYERAERFLQKRSDKCSYFLVQLLPGNDISRVCGDIQRILPEVEAYPKDVYSRISVNFWMTRTGLGISFGAATLLGLFVGLIIVAQTLYTLVLDRLIEFATLKAIGAKDQQVYQILFAQALIMAGVGTAIGLCIVTLLQMAFSTPRAPILVPWWLSLTSCVLVLLICLISSLLPYLRIRKLDPQIVLQS